MSVIRKYIDKIPFPLKSDNINEYFTWWPMEVLNLSEFFVEKQNI